jgi:hypothetical protein
VIPGIDTGPGDDVDTGAVIRNNLLCQVTPKSGSQVVRAPSAAVNTGNVYRTGTDATTGVCAR